MEPPGAVAPNNANTMFFLGPGAYLCSLFSNQNVSECGSYLRCSQQSQAVGKTDAGSYSLQNTSKYKQDVVRVNGQASNHWPEREPRKTYQQHLFIAKYITKSACNLWKISTKFSASIQNWVLYQDKCSNSERIASNQPCKIAGIGESKSISEGSIYYCKHLSESCLCCGPCQCSRLEILLWKTSDWLVCTIVLSILQRRTIFPPSGSSVRPKIWWKHLSLYDPALRYDSSHCPTLETVLLVPFHPYYPRPFAKYLAIVGN